MYNLNILYLSQEDILKLSIKIADVIKIIEEALKEHALNKVEMPPKIGVHPKDNAFIHAMPAYFVNKKISGIKWVSGYPDNRAIGLPQIFGILVLNDVETGAPLCIMDCTWITAVRTAAVSAISVKYLCKKNAETVGIIGAGVQGTYNLLAFTEVMPYLRKVKVFDINKSAAKNFAINLTEITNIDIEATANVESAVRGSDVILTATQKQEKPIVKNEWFGKGALGLGLEVARAWDAEILKTADKFITDDKAQSLYFNLMGAFPGGMPEPYALLGEILLGLKQGRENETERIVAFNVGLAVGDIALADKIFKIAKKEKCGSELNLMKNLLIKNTYNI